MRLAPLALLALAAATPAAAQDRIAKQAPLTPADERKSFTLPPGFEAQLVAAEPDIGKPIQMAFDAKGRLWVTTSRHYPYAAEAGKASDRLFVLSDFAPDGKARKVEVFAADLNIPIGILPLPDCRSCLVSSVGEILKLTDTDGDGKAERREVLFGGFGTEDTHGMVNSFTLMPDGWVYATHGFKNTSKVKGRDGHEIQMTSGHTFRFRPDGSRIEVFTRGQVNPFGLAVDPWFNLYTADCHSKPITQLIRGAMYQSFGRPHDGLGYAPHVTDHPHGSTALCGLTWYDADQFPKEYKGCMFLGNVVTNRVNFDRIEWVGGSPVAKELPDFLTSTDPWFRPTDVRLGPDGALYVADFYNRIIGHYEVPLNHPDRDRDRGRVWRVVWKGLDGKAKPPATPFADLTTQDVRSVYDLLDSPNLTVRLLATNQLIHRVDEFARASTEGIRPAKPFSEIGLVHAGWRMFRQSSDPAVGVTATLTTLKQHHGPLSVAHEVKQAAHIPVWTPQLRAAVLTCLADHPQVRRAVAETLIDHPHADNVKPLAELLKATKPTDNHTRHAARVALRNALSSPGGWAAAADADLNAVADVAVAVPSADAARFVADRLAGAAADPANLPAVAELIARQGSPADRDRLLDAFRRDRPAVRQLDAWKGFAKGLAARGEPARDGEKAAATAAVAAGLKGTDPAVAQACCAVAADLKLTAAGPALRDAAAGAGQQDAVRGAALDAWVRVDPTAGYAGAARLVADPLTRPDLREKAAAALAASADPGHRAFARAALKSVPYRSAVVVAAALAGSRAGADGLFAAVRAGEASPRLLQEQSVLGRLRAGKVPNLDTTLAELTKGLPPADQRLAELLKRRAAGFAKATPDKALGAQLYTKHCAACHQINNQGGKVGPQLDGLGVRGAERIAEDVLDPNRNVDAAFRARVLHLADGRVLTVLLKGVEGETVVAADTEGKEQRFPSKEIEKQTVTGLSLMPANFDSTLPEADFYHLLAYLLDQKPKDVPKP